MRYLQVISLCLVMIVGICCSSCSKDSQTKKEESTGLAGPCYTGLFIIGQGKHAGIIEMEGCAAESVVYSPMQKGNADPEGFDGLVGKNIIKHPELATPSVLLSADDDGRFILPDSGGIKWKYLTIEGTGDDLKLVAHSGEHRKVLNRAYILSDWVTEYRKITPFLRAPDGTGFLSLVTTIYLDEGKLIEGRCFHMHSYETQVSKMVTTTRISVD